MDYLEDENGDPISEPIKLKTLWEKDSYWAAIRRLLTEDEGLVDPPVGADPESPETWDDADLQQKIDEVQDKIENEVGVLKNAFDLKNSSTALLKSAEPVKPGHPKYQQLCVVITDIISVDPAVGGMLKALAAEGRIWQREFAEGTGVAGQANGGVIFIDMCHIRYWIGVESLVHEATHVIGGLENGGDDDSIEIDEVGRNRPSKTDEQRLREIRALENHVDSYLRGALTASLLSEAKRASAVPEGRLLSKRALRLATGTGVKKFKRKIEEVRASFDDPSLAPPPATPSPERCAENSLKAAASTSAEYDRTDDPGSSEDEPSLLDPGAP